MRRTVLIFCILFLSTAAFAGFKVKNIKPKKPEQFQVQTTIAGVTYAADLLIEGGDQKAYFYRELIPFNLAAVRLAVFNGGREEVALPLDGVELLDPDSRLLPLVGPELVASAVVEEKPVQASSESRLPQVGMGPSVRDPRRDPSSPQYDPRMDPNSPHYDPHDPRNQNPYPPSTYPPQTNPPGTYPPATVPGTYPAGGTLGGPGIVLNPGGSGEDLSRFERELAMKDFSDKAHTSEPILPAMKRDRFLYFSLPAKPAAKKGYTLRMSVSKGIPQEVILNF
jgi:hypothetical protein